MSEKTEKKATEPKDNTFFLMKVKLLVRLSKKPDSEERDMTIRAMKVKLTQKEWDNLIAGTYEGVEGKVSESFAKLCQDKYDMIKKYSSTKAKGEGKPRAKMYMGTPAEEAGVEFTKRLDALCENSKDLLDVLEENGIDFQPFWRNLNNKGKGKPKKEDKSE